MASFASKQQRLKPKKSASRTSRADPVHDEPRLGEEVAVSSKGWKRVRIEPTVYDGLQGFGGLVELEELEGDDAAAYAAQLGPPERFDDEDSDQGSALSDEPSLADADSPQQQEPQRQQRQQQQQQQQTVEELEPFVPPASMSAWLPFGLHHSILRGLHELGFTAPTPVQMASLAAALTRGNDVIGAAETGSGKTLAFALPVLHALVSGAGRGAASGPFCIVLCPTRELAIQVTSHIKRVATYCREMPSGNPVSVVSVIGGMSEQKQLRMLSRRPAIVVGTPGRLWEFVTRKPAPGAASSRTAVGETFLNDLTTVRFLVVDEADAMMRSGRFKEVEQMLK